MNGATVLIPGMLWTTDDLENLFAFALLSSGLAQKGVMWHDKIDGGDRVWTRPNIYSLASFSTRVLLPILQERNPRLYCLCYNKTVLRTVRSIIVLGVYLACPMNTSNLVDKSGGSSWCNVLQQAILKLTAA